MTRSFSIRGAAKGRVRAATGLIACLALTGFGGKANHSVNPTPLCDLGCDDLPAAFLDAQQKLGHTHTDVVTSIGTWSQFENCRVGTGAPPPGTTDNGIRTCFFDANGITYDPAGRPCRCYYKLDDLENYLDAYVGDPSATGGLGVDAMLQLAPIFTTSRTIPPYLWNNAFQDQAMIDAYNALWDQVSARLAQPKYQSRTFFVSIGNEINLYLAVPTGAPRPAAVPGEETTKAAWQSYQKFYQATSNHVRTGGSGAFTRVVGTTLTWFACGGGQSIATGTVDPSCAGIPPPYMPFGEVFDNAWVTDVIDRSDVEVFTMYRKFLATDTDTAIADTLGNDFAAMAFLGYARGQMPVFLQELGHPSGESSPTDRLLEHQQERMVISSMDRISEVNALVRANTGGWTPFEGFSFFHMHDFRTSVADEFFDCSAQACPPGFTCEATPAGDGRWYLRDAESGPGARQEPDLAFDPVRSRIVLFGGVEVPPSTPTERGFQDTWVSDISLAPSVPPSPWRKLTTAGGPPPGNGSDSVYVHSRDRLITVAHNGTSGLVEFWALQFGADGNSGTWTRLSPSGGTLALRPFGRALYDSVRDRVLYFGGRAASTQGSYQVLAALDLTQGSDGYLSTSLHSSIPGREEFGFFFDPTGNRAILYGGADSTQRFGDAWQIDFTGGAGGSASALTQVGSTVPGHRTFFAFANDAGGRRAILFGGLVGATGPTLANDLWRGDYSTPGQLAWTPLNPDPAQAGPPSPRGRVGAGATFVPGADRMLQYGGISDIVFTPLADTWELQFAPRTKCVISTPGCSTDLQCDATAAAIGVLPGSLKCCTDALFCTPAQLGTCVVPAACDFATLLIPTTTCTDGDGSLCASGEMCNSVHKCVKAADRADFCSWGLIDGSGAAKPAWDAFATKSSQFVP